MAEREKGHGEHGTKISGLWITLSPSNSEVAQKSLGKVVLAILIHMPFAISPPCISLRLGDELNNVSYNNQDTRSSIEVDILAYARLNICGVFSAA